MQTFKIEKTDSQCVVTWRHYTRLGVFVMFSGLAFMAIPLVTLTPHALHALIVFCAALSIWIFWLLSFAFVVHMLFGETQFVLDEDGLNAIYTCLTFESEKRFALTEIRRFEKDIRWRKNRDTCLLRVSFHEESDNSMKSFRLHTNGSKSKSFCLPVKGGIEDELDVLCEQLNAFLETLKAEIIDGG